jgi:hypothetical protein
MEKKYFFFDSHIKRKSRSLEYKTLLYIILVVGGCIMTLFLMAALILEQCPSLLTDPIEVLAVVWFSNDV